MRPDKCPVCNADFTGEPIPEKSREYYGDATHFSRVIGIVDLDRDKVTQWRCPDCGASWDR